MPTATQFAHSITLDHIVLTDNSEERVLRVPQPQTEVIVEDTKGK